MGNSGQVSQTVSINFPVTKAELKLKLSQNPTVPYPQVIGCLMSSIPLLHRTRTLLHRARTIPRYLAAKHPRTSEHTSLKHNASPVLACFTQFHHPHTVPRRHKPTNRQPTPPTPIQITTRHTTRDAQPSNAQEKVNSGASKITPNRNFMQFQVPYAIHKLATD